MIMLPAMLIFVVVIGLPVAWLVAEFRWKRPVRVTLGVLAVLCSFGVAAIIGMLFELNYNAWYGSATKDLINTTVEQVEDGQLDRVMTVLRSLNRLTHFGVVVPFAVAGFFLTASRWRRLWILYGVVLLMSVSVILFFILARYRQPMVPVLVLFAGGGVAELLQRRSLRRPITWLALLAAAVFAVWSNRPFPYEQTQRAIGYYSVGSALVGSGREQQALPLLREALRSEPNFAA